MCHNRSLHPFLIDKRLSTLARELLTGTCRSRLFSAAARMPSAGINKFIIHDLTGPWGTPRVGPGAHT
jgi:hypothetical protein